MLVLPTGCFSGISEVAGSGISATEQREVGAFKSVSSSGSMDLSITIGTEQSVRVTADDNLLPLIETKLVGSQLRIRPVEPISARTDLRVDIVIPVLEGVALSGSGSATLAGLTEPSLDLSIAGSGDVSASGTADNLSASIAGSGSLRLFNLATKAAEIKIAGSGDAEINAAESLSAAIAGSGSVRYAGAPQLQQKVSGSGTIRQKD